MVETGSTNSGIRGYERNRRKRVNLTTNGKSITAPESLSVIQALWHSGYPRVKSIGCLQGVCGSCRVMVRHADSHEVTTGLAYQLPAEAGMQVSFLVFPNPAHHTHEFTGIKNSLALSA